MFKEANKLLHRPAAQSSGVTPELLTQRWTPGLCLEKGGQNGGIPCLLPSHERPCPTKCMMKSSHTLGGFRDLF